MSVRINFAYFILLTLAGACQAQQPSDRPSCQDKEFDNKVASTISFTVPLISCAELHEEIGNKEELYILDAREPEEFNISHIPGARYIGYDDFELSSLSELNKDAKLIVYCSIGYRSEKIGEQIRKAGYENVFNLYGSIFEWANLGYPLTDLNERPTKVIHTYNSKWSKWVSNPGLEKVF